MEQTIYDRVKLIRESKKMSQAEFSNLLGMGHSTFGMIEVGKRKILDRHIKTICSLCGVNEEWLRNGVGEIFIENDDTVIDQLTGEYHLDQLDRRIIKSYLQLEESQRKVIKDYIKSVFKDQLKEEIANDIDTEVESYRRELEQEKNIKTSSALQQSGENAG